MIQASHQEAQAVLFFVSFVGLFRIKFLRTYKN